MLGGTRTVKSRNDGNSEAVWAPGGRSSLARKREDDFIQVILLRISK